MVFNYAYFRSENQKLGKSYGDKIIEEIKASVDTITNKDSDYSYIKYDDTKKNANNKG